MKARSRITYRRKLSRIKNEIRFMLLPLMVLYTGYQIISTGVLHPVKALAEVQFIEVEKPVEVIKEVEVDRTFITQKQQILAYIVEKFGDDAPDAIVLIRKCENGSFNPEATNWNRNGTWDAGIFQVNQVHGYSLEEMYDYKKNIDAAYKIFKGRGWTAWSCSEHVGVKPFWKQ